MQTSPHSCEEEEEEEKDLGSAAGYLSWDNSGNDPAALTDYTRAGRACNIEVSDVKIVPSVSELGSKSSAKQNPDIQDSNSNAWEGETIMISVRTSRSRPGNVSG